MTRKVKTTRKYILLSAYLLLTAGNSFAQLHHQQLPQNNKAVLAEELFNQKQYANAAAAAKAYLQQQRDITNQKTYPEKDKANYILTVSQLNSGNPDAELTAANYIHSTANPVYKQRAAFALANHYFRANAYNDAIHYYEMAGIGNLDNDELIYARFELAYCYFNNSRFDEAEPLLASVRELEGKYYDAGNYYYGLLAYNKSNYPEALASFERIRNNPLYVNIVPYYIAEIHYFTNNKEKALDDALKLIKGKEKSYYHNELHLLAAQVHFENNEYKEALPYFEYYYDNTERIRKEDLYEMAYSYYQVNDWKNAIENFKLLSETRDSLAQSSLYLLGDCYLKTNDKTSARNAFSLCADMPFNPGQKEASLLLAAKLSYETGYNNDAIYYINLLLADYPASAYNDEAKTILSDLLIRTRNYSEAYDALQDVTKHNANYKRIYQKVTYSYAMQLMLTGNQQFADSLLTMSLAEGTDLAYKAAAQFWKADLAYKTGNYNNSIKYGTAFAGNSMKEWVTYISPEATDKNNYITLGYAAMELSKFADAENYFTKARAGQGASDSNFVLTTVLREADAVFMQKGYNRAIGLYDRVIAANTADADYARYQKAIILGLINKNKEKAELLTSIINNTATPRYANEARYELGLTYIEEDKYAAAINVLTPLTQAFEVRNMAPKAWMKIGFAQQQSGQAEKAIVSYKTIVSEYPTSEERPAALDALKSLYIQAGTPELYALLLKEGNMGGAEDNMMDSAYYATAETQYGAGNWAKAKTSLNNYLQKYPNGVFVNKANYYKAESHYQLREYTEALAGYELVLNSNWSDFSENSARRAAAIAYQQKDMAGAKKYYSMLRNMAMEKENLQIAYNGLMMSTQALNEYNLSSLYADTLSSMPGISEAMMANAQLVKAQALLKSGRMDEALPVFKQIEKADAAIAAEARYNVAYIYYMQGLYKDAEAAANNTIKLSGGQDYWIVKSYILIADVLVQQKDYFNAKATLQSIVKNSKIPELKTVANNKLKDIKELETKKTKVTN